MKQNTVLFAAYRADDLKNLSYKIQGIKQADMLNYGWHKRCG